MIELYCTNSRNDGQDGEGTGRMTGIFLSYARGDDEAFVRRLYERIVADGHDVWFDRECMPSRALTFLQEIRDAVRGRERTVVVIGPSAVTSDYVRAEWQAALVEGKIVTPVLRLGDFDLLPAELRNLHCPDLRAARDTDVAWAELKRVLAQPVPPLGALVGAVPELPPRFQPRPDNLSTLAQHLLYDIEHPAVIEGPLRTTVLHGMGGVGKSVLAAAIARATTTRRVFADGVVWVSAARDLGPLDLIRTLLRLMSVPFRAGVGLDNAVTALRERLDGRRYLIVVDNVWSIETVAPVAQALSTVARMLVTTRDAALVTGLGARDCPLDVLAPEAALRQLADWAGRDVDALPPQAAEIAQRCGYLPFALALQGALVHEGVPWDDLLDELRHSQIDFAEQRFAAYPYPTVLAALRASIDMLRATDAGAAAAFDRLSAFVWEDGVPEAAIVRLWGHGSDAVSERNARKRLVQLKDKSLLRLEGEAPSRRVRLHDLMRDYLVATTDVPAVNRALLAAYRAACAGDWRSGPNDGYFFENLTYHLVEAGNAGELHELLQRENEHGKNVWYMCQAVIDPSGALYLRDQRRAWTAVDAVDAAAAAHRQACPSIGLEIQYALATSSVHSRSSNIPPALLAALCQNRVWTHEQTLAVARQTPGLGERAGALSAIAAVLAEPGRTEIYREALSALQALIGSTEEWRPKEALERLVSSLPQALLDDALQIARLFEDGENRAEALIGIALRLPEPNREAVLNEAVAAAHAVAGEGALANQAIALAKISAALVDPRRTQVLQEALVVARSLDGRDSWRARTLADVAAQVSEPAKNDILCEALNAAKAVPWQPAGADTGEIRWAQERTMALAEIAPKLPESLLDGAVAAARRLRAVEDRDKVLQALATRLAELGEPRRALAAAKAIKGERPRSNALIDVATNMSEVADLKAVLATARKLAEGRAASQVVAVAAAGLARAGRPAEALAAAESVEKPNWLRVQMFARLAVSLPENLRGEAVQKVLAAGQDEVFAAEADDPLMQLVLTLAKALQFDNALAAARLFPERTRSGDVGPRAAALTLLAPHLPDHLRAAVLIEAVEAAQAVGDAFHRAWLLGAWSDGDTSHATPPTTPSRTSWQPCLQSRTGTVDRRRWFASPPICQTPCLTRRSPSPAASKMPKTGPSRSPGWPSDHRSLPKAA
jgi:hypothetical protein